MIEEDQNEMCSNNSDGGSSVRSSTKKMKQKKVPQRGLGVAQLEKIRMEEQQKKQGNNNFPSPNSKAINNQKPSSKPCIPPLSTPTMPMNLSPPNPSCSNLPNTGINFDLGSIPPLSPNNGDGFQAGWRPSVPVHGNISFPKMWYPNRPHDHGDNLILSLPSSNVAPLPDVLPRSTQHQPPSSNSSLVNALSSSSVLNFPMEPPSNQSFYSTYSTFWPDDEKMIVGMKRSCPFPLDNPPIPTFHNNIAPVATQPLKQSDESTSGGNGGTTYNLDPGIPIFRNFPSWPTAMRAEVANSNKINISENGNSNTKEFLCLAPPPITSSFPISRSKHISALDNMLPFNVSVEDPLSDSRQGGSSQQPNLLSFFPHTKLQAMPTAPSPASHNRRNSEVGDKIDLNLRL